MRHSPDTVAKSRNELEKGSEKLSSCSLEIKDAPNELQKRTTNFGDASLQQKQDSERLYDIRISEAGTCDSKSSK